MKEKILQFINTLKQQEDWNSVDEAATKQTIVLPLLHILDWDIFSQTHIVTEYNFKNVNDRVDYCLRNGVDNNFMLIEVKRPRENLDQHEMQLLKYAFFEGINLACLTNGFSWRFYLPMQSNTNFRDRMFYQIDIVEQNNQDVAGRFISFLSREEVLSGRTYKSALSEIDAASSNQKIMQTLPSAWELMLEENSGIVADLIANTLCKPLADIVSEKCGYEPSMEVATNYIRSKIQSLVQAETPVISSTNTAIIDFTNKKPESFVFCEKKFPVNSWLDVLRKLTSEIYTKHKSEFQKVLSIQGRKRKNFSKNMSDLSRFGEKIDNSVFYMETNLSANQLVNTVVVKLLKVFNYNQSQFLIQIRRDF